MKLWLESGWCKQHLCLCSMVYGIAMLNDDEENEKEKYGDERILAIFRKTDVQCCAQFNAIVLAN